MKRLLLLFVLVLYFIETIAQPGIIDTSFNPVDDVDGQGVNETVYSIFLQPDGKVLIGGSFNSYNDVSINRIARLNPDGSLDKSFNPGSGSNNGFVGTIILQPDGKMIIGGEFFSYHGVSRNNIARLNADGTLDTSFNPGTGANSTVKSIVLQPDGKIVIGGSFTRYNGTVRGRIARLNADGTLDTSFNPGTGPNGGGLVPSLYYQTAR